MTECKHGHRYSQDDPECFQCRDQSYKEEIAELQAKVEDYKDTEATLMAKLFTTEEKLKGAELQLNEIRRLCDMEGDLPHRIVAIKTVLEWHRTNDSRHLIDYRQLLSKYVDLVEDLEGVTFIYNIGESKVVFSEEEIAALHAIDKEPRK